jgi:hypothetical protein
MSQLGVALVSAGSALTGATIGGMFTLLKGRQEARERQADREEQRRQRRLDSRRTAYVAFLMALSEVEDSYRGLYEFQVPATVDAYDTAERPTVSAFNRLFQAVLEVDMVGPAVMAAQAERVLDQARTVIEEYAGCFESHAARDQEASLISLMDNQGRLINRLAVQRDRFIKAARVQLGGDTNEVPPEILRSYIGSLADDVP